MNPRIILHAVLVSLAFATLGWAQNKQPSDADSELLTRREMARPQSDAILRILLGKCLEISSTPGLDGIR